MSDQRATLFLMTKKGLKVLKGLIETGFQKHIGLVVIGRDANQQDFSDDIERLCVDKALPYCFKNDFEKNEEFDYALAIGWRWMIKNVNNLIVLHDSLLPKYRGFAPLVNSLLNKEKTIGATALWASEQYDRGDILLQKSFNINYPVKVGQAIESMASCYAEIVTEIFEMISNGKKMPRKAQNNEMATYSLWRDEDDYHIDWSLSPEAVQLFVNSLGDPYKGAFSIVNQRKVRIFDVEVLENVTLERRDFGKVLFVEEGRPCVVCGSGLVKINSAAYDDNHESILPLKSIRTRFT